MKKLSPAPILVVDDDRADRFLLATSLSTAGFETVEVSTGRRALELLSHGTFSAVLLDLNMPGMSGLEVLGAIRTHRATLTLPVILVTSADDVAERVRGLSAGATDYIVKPFDADELVARVTAQLRGQSAWAEVVESHLRERAAIASALCQLKPEASAEVTAALICEQLQAQGNLSGVALIAFLGDGIAVPLAATELSTWNLTPNRPLPRTLTTYLYDRALHGPWIERLDVAGASAFPGGPFPDSGTLACAPMHRDGQLLGILLLGADPPDGRAQAADVGRALSEAIDFGGIASGLLGLTLLERSEREGRRLTLDTIIRGQLFHPVFQPIVRLTDTTIVGYEALTRFDDGLRPDLRFAEAAGLQLGIELELATLAATIDAARDLPPEHFLSLNVSPALVMSGPPLPSLLEPIERSVVLELTEHDPVDDYPALRDALDHLSPDLQVSVDDAGAGFASLSHVLALRPQFMKLDQSWVAGIESDPARQALVAGLDHFADATGCLLIAEGIETEGQLDMLRSLDVDLGQGFLLGRPEALAAPA
jgi:EAL domain-containing protein (putative c-di-GMP-specific phosphodiesterase class I)/DNA-binding response OmpR family regulator